MNNFKAITSRLKGEAFSGKNTESKGEMLNATIYTVPVLLRSMTSMTE